MADSEKDIPPQTLLVATAQHEAPTQEIERLTKYTQQGGLVQSPKSQALLELEETGIRGGGMVLLRVVVQDLEESLRQEKATTAKLREEIDTWRERYHSEKGRADILQTEIAGLTKLKILQNFLLSIGGTGLGLGLKLIVDDKFSVGFCIAIAGIAFLFAGWLWVRGPKKSDEHK